MTRRITFPFDPYKAVWVDLPDEWLGEHWLRRAKVISTLGARLEWQFFLDVATALAVASDWGNIPGLSSRNPEEWDLTKVPLILLAWLANEVTADYDRTFTVPKVLLSPSPPG